MIRTYLCSSSPVCLTASLLLLVLLDLQGFIRLLVLVAHDLLSVLDPALRPLGLGKVFELEGRVESWWMTTTSEQQTYSVENET